VKEILNLGSNRLVGKIPSELGMLNELTSLNLSNNSLEGFPAEIGRMTNLGRIQLSTNQLNSTIPTELEGLERLGKSSSLFCSHRGTSFLTS
jgi:Leucine-rich repeat (LRR) protein